ncbi:DUF3850 domain-containing protein [Patescibacteria group bacterium]|nr:DUF3850 domain-containing protein [Patescibacteria group bacterium]MBU1868281.1 DUF3850 domain-containing protein [Patescibacteria group bacterium]
MKIQKKVWPEYFEKIISGDKTFEVRLADWECKEGDILVLEEWDPKTKDYTRRKIEKKVACIAKTKDCQFWSKEDIEKHGFQIIGIK